MDASLVTCSFVFHTWRVLQLERINYFLRSCLCSRLCVKFLAGKLGVQIFPLFWPGCEDKLLSNSYKTSVNTSKDEQNYHPTFLLLSSGSRVTKYQVYQYTKIEPNTSYYLICPHLVDFYPIRKILPPLLKMSETR